MARKKRKFERDIDPVTKYINGLKYKQLKVECIIRGMSFEEVLGKSVYDLNSWVAKNFTNKIDHSLLDKFDDWQDGVVKKIVKNKSKSSKVIVHPSLRLGYIAEKDDEGNVVKRRRVKTIFKKEKKKRERTKDGIFTGTKKAYTFQLQQEGLPKEEVIKMVIDKFPDASQKSINIWFNKSRKLNK